MGYSVTVGDFAGQGIQGVAVGVPRGSDLRGLVCFLSVAYFILFSVNIKKIFCNVMFLLWNSSNVGCYEFYAN